MAPAVLVGVAAPVAGAGATAAVPVRVRRALPAALVVPRQAQAAAALVVVELRQLVEPAKKR